jgi:uncharacterized protein HemX
MKRNRAVLNDDATKPRFIETVVGKGYRFIAEVESVEVESPPPASLVELKQPESPVAFPAPVPITNEAQSSATAERGGRWNWTRTRSIAVLLVLAMGGVVWYAWPTRTKRGMENEAVLQQVTTLVPETMQLLRQFPIMGA